MAKKPPPKPVDTPYSILGVSQFHQLKSIQGAFDTKMAALQAKYEAVKGDPAHGVAPDPAEIAKIEAERKRMRLALDAITAVRGGKVDYPNTLSVHLLQGISPHKDGFKHRVDMGDGFVYKTVDAKTGFERGYERVRKFRAPLGIVKVFANNEITDPAKAKRIGTTIQVLGVKFTIGKYKEPGRFKQTVNNFLFKQTETDNPQHPNLPKDLQEKSILGYAYNQKVETRFHNGNTVRADTVTTKSGLNQIKEEHSKIEDLTTGDVLRQETMEVGRMGLTRINNTLIGRQAGLNLPDLALFNANVQTMTPNDPAADNERHFELNIGKVGTKSLFKRNVDTITDKSGATVDKDVRYEVLGFKNKILGIPLHK